MKERLRISSQIDWTPIYLTWYCIFASLRSHQNTDRCAGLIANVGRSYADEEASRVRWSRARVQLLLEGTTEQDSTTELDGTRNSLVQDAAETNHLLVNLGIISSTLRLWCGCLSLHRLKIYAPKDGAKECTPSARLPPQTMNSTGLKCETLDIAIQAFRP
jgi:hypothetical protein